MKMPDNEKDFAQEQFDALREHLERTRREASGGFPPRKPEPTVVVGQFDEPVKTPVEEHLGGADPQSAVGVVDDYRDVAAIDTDADDKLIASEASKQGVKRQRKAADAPVKPPAPEDGSFALNDHINYPHPEEPLPPHVNMKGDVHEDAHVVDEANAEKKE